MRNYLERIRTWLEREAPNLASSLQPGLSREQMLEVMGPISAKYRIPEEVVELYRWRNGQAGAVPFFDVLRFQPFEEAVEYGNLVEEYSDGMFPLMVFQDLSYDAGYRFICGPKEEKLAPACRWDHGDERVETSSLADLLSAAAEAFEGGVFQPNGSGDLDTQEDAWNSILVRHHPGRIRSVNDLLHRQWAALSSDRIRDALYDLVRMNHAETPALVREYLVENPDLPERDFETFYAVLSTGFTIHDEWTRDFALSLVLSQRSRARQTALSFLAWMWQGELSLTPQHVQELIDQLTSSPPSDSDNRERAMLLGVSGDSGAVPALLRLLEVSSADRDTRIAALNALERLRAVEARPVFLIIAKSDSDPGTRIAAVRALVELGFEDAPVEAAAKAYFREMLQQFGTFSTEGEKPTIKRWIEETKQFM